MAINQYQGNPPPPQRLSASARHAWFGTLSGSAGLRIASSRRPYGSHTYTGTQLTPQRFIPATSPNNPAVLPTRTQNNRSRALGQQRGSSYA